MIQMLTFQGNEIELKGKGVKLNKIHDAEALDSYEINIISLQDRTMWKTREASPVTIDSIGDLSSLSKMIESSKHANIIILLPQNENFMYEAWRPNRSEWRHLEFKNILQSFKNVLGHIFEPLTRMYIMYENTITRIDDKKVPASFHFNEMVKDVLTKSEKSNKPTTVKVEGVILSTLNINNYAEILSFLTEIGLIKEESEAPEWMEGLNMFDDSNQLKIIQENNMVIEMANENISNAMKVINQNKRYKSVLYTSGDELVEIIFEILEKMLGCSLSGFIDKKKEDFNFKIGDKVFKLNFISNFQLSA